MFRLGRLTIWLAGEINPRPAAGRNPHRDIGL